MHKSKNPQLLGRNMQLANAITNKIDEIKAFISSNQTTQQASPPTILTSSPPIPINDDSRNLADNINDQLNNDPFYLVYLDDTKQYKQIYIQKTANTYKYSIDNNTYNIIYNIDYKITDVGKEKNLQYILEINTVNKTNIDLLKEATGNENIREFISKIRMIGSDSRDYTLVNRDDDYYLNMTNGVSIDIKFTDNYINNFSAEINTDTSVNELLPTNFGGTDEDKKGYKAYKFKTATIYVIKDTDTHAITIDYYKETNVSDIYLDILNKGISSLNKCKKIFATQNIIITLILKNGTLNKSINDETFKGLIEKIDIPASELSYKLGFKYIKENGQEIIPTNGIYKVDLYIENITFKTQSMNLWLENAINNINTETLDNQLDEIITPMFDMDNEIDKRDKIVKRVRDIYRFNKLSNSQNNMRFYNSHY